MMILQRCGYGLKGIYSLEDYYAQNLGGYYESLAVGPSHNYHLGRVEADVSGFVEYFCKGMGGCVFESAGECGEPGGSQSR